jgi:putative oxidoreductase
MFPLGLPGLALLLLRLSVASAVLAAVYAREQDLAAWLLVASGLLAILLVAGIVTPLIAIIAVVAQLLSLPGLTGSLAIFIGTSVLNALALALLGPGAYSIDASRFGRRVVKLPSIDDE